MKILVLSLLRLGDILLHRELARTIKRQYPNCELHFLIYSQFQSVESLMPEVDRWHLIDRKALQNILVEREQSPLAAFQLLEEAISALNAENFSLIFNATHNRFSVRLMDLVQGEEKRGVALDMGRKTSDQNPWQTYLNENFSELQGSRFHYVEVLHRALGLPFHVPSDAEFRKPGIILLQLLTSDPKKNWGLRRFHELKRKLENEFPDHRVLGLCSPQEEEQVSKVFDWNEFISPSLEEAHELLKEARLLITGDTSIQHLATQVGCPTVSLFLGSADPVKTAPWQMGAWVVQGQAPCFPCSHSSACHQPDHLCALYLTVETVFELVTSLLKNQPVLVSRGAYSQTKENAGSFMVERQGAELEIQLEQSVWSAYLNASERQMDLEGNFSREEIMRLQSSHNRFQAAIAQLIEQKTDIETIEAEFPLWRDSLARYKHDAKAVGEIQELISIRSEILNRLYQQKEVSHVGNSKHIAQECLA